MQKLCVHRKDVERLSLFVHKPAVKCSELALRISSLNNQSAVFEKLIFQCFRQPWLATLKEKVKSQGGNLPFQDEIVQVALRLASEGKITLR